jgi:hypothetical protein
MALEVVRFSAGLMFCKNFVIHVNAVKQFKVQWSVHAQSGHKSGTESAIISLVVLLCELYI